MANVKTKSTRKIANPIETASTPDRDFAHTKLPQNKDSMTGEIAKQISGTGNDFIAQLLGWDTEFSSNSEFKADNRLSGELQLGVAVELKSLKKDRQGHG